MRRIDELHLELPFAGSRMLRDLLRREAIDIGREHVRTLMRRIGITRDLPAAEDDAATSSSPGVSRISSGRSPSLDRITSGRRTSRTSRWRAASSISSSIMDWASRKVLTWRAVPDAHQ